MTKEMVINILRGDVLGTNEQTHEAVFMAIKALKEQERVDAVEVVRCKDCKYYEETDSRIGTCLLTMSGAGVGGFCAWAEWKDDETD